MPVPLHANGHLLCADQATWQGGSPQSGNQDRATAKRKLADLHRELGRTAAASGRVSLVDLRDRYLATVQNQKEKTLKSKRRIAARIKTDFPGGADVAVGKVLPSQVAAWLASYNFGVASYNLYPERFPFGSAFCL